MIQAEPLSAPEILELLHLDNREPVTITSLTGGYRNRLQRVEGEGFDVVIKQYAAPDDNPLFPLLFEDECRALASFQDDGIAPHLIAADPKRRLLVYEFVPGAVWNGDVIAMGALLQRVGGVPPPGWLRSLPSSVDELRSQTADILHALANPPGGLLEPFQVDDQPFPPGLIHTDCGPGNVVGGSGHYTLIDWQCPGVGDPVEDLSSFTSPGVQILYGRDPLGKGEVDELLAAHGDERVAERYRWKAPLYSARFAAYCAWRIERLETRAEIDRYREALAAELELLQP